MIGKKLFMFFIRRVSDNCIDVIGEVSSNVEFYAKLRRSLIQQEWDARVLSRSIAQPKSTTTKGRL